MTSEQSSYVSRAGWKLAGALDAFDVDVRGLSCADFGCNVGGFTDCLIRRGADVVYAVDTGYGELAWKLRKHPRVIVMERTNALHVDPPACVDLVCIDVAWTPQRLIIPAAMNWLNPGAMVISLLKPHYESAKITGHKPHAALSEQESHNICLHVCEGLLAEGMTPSAVMHSPLIGKGGNAEFLLLLHKPVK